jgi:propionate CoA-transferase
MRLVDIGEAVRLVDDGDTVMIGGSGAGHAVPQLFIDRLAGHYVERGSPRGLTTVRVVGIGDFAERGMSQLALPGLMKRTIGSNIGNEPALGEMVQNGEVEAYSFPQGVLSQLCREIAAGRPGLVTHIGLGTYVDPRHTGGKQGSATEDLVEVIELGDREWLFYHAFPVHVAVIRGSRIDVEGNLTMEREAVRGEMLAMAMAARNSDGIVIAQAGELASADELDHRRVEVPGALIDYAYIDPEQRQTYQTSYSPYLSGERRLERKEGTVSSSLDLRKIVARRSLLEFAPGDICNLGFGISQEIGEIAHEEGIDGRLVLTVEQGVFGGVPVAGPDGGAGFNFQALIEQPAMFDFYDGGGLDVASLSFAQVDVRGNVNVHAFPGRLRGPGGFLNISARTAKVCFVGTFTTGGLVTEIVDGRIRILEEGSTPKFVESVEEISFSGPGSPPGQQVLYLTERAVFALVDGVVTLIEVADGIDLEKDVLGNMEFRPALATPVARIDPRIYEPELMGLSAEFGSAR